MNHLVEEGRAGRRARKKLGSTPKSMRSRSRKKGSKVLVKNSVLLRLAAEYMKT